MANQFDRAKAVQVLNFWHKVEFFVPYDLGQVIDGGSETYRLDRKTLENSSPRDLFWLEPNHRTDREQYCLYIGLFESRDIEEICRQSGILETDEIRRMEDHERGIEQTCFAKLPLSSDGRANWDKFSVSTLPWALSRLRDGDLKTLSSDAFEQAKQELRHTLDNFASSLKRPKAEHATEHEASAQQSRPLTGDDIIQLAELLFAWSGYVPKEYHLVLLEVYPLSSPRRMHQTDQSSTLKHKLAASAPGPSTGEEENDDEDDNESASIDILNSFYFEDLEEALQAVRDGDGHPPLDSYLQSPAIHHIDVYSKEGRAAVCDKLQPKFTSAARWLDQPERRMSMMQQFAINASLEKLSHAGMYAVNGPPGTGKTTMLKEVIAEIIVQRARALSKLSSPERAWAGKTSVSFTGESNSYEIGVLDENLTGFEVIVASSNNTAVENISKDLPLQKSRDTAWNSVSYLLPVARKVFADHKNGKVTPLKDEDQPWGLISGVLGKKSNRQKFAQRLVYDPDGGEEAQNRKQKGEYLNLRDWADRYQGPSFREASNAFVGCDAELQQRLARLQEYATLHAEFANASEYPYCQVELNAVSRSQAAHDAAQSELASFDGKKASLAELLRRLEREEQILNSLRPPWYKTLFTWSAENREHKTKLRMNRLEQVRLSEEIRQVEEVRTRQSNVFEAAARALQTAQADLTGRKFTFARAKEKLSRFAAEFEVLLPPSSSEQLEDDKYQKSALWQDTALNDLRSRLFAAALQLHESWLASVLKKKGGFRPNAIAIAKLMSGAMPNKLEHVLPIWQSLFMIVPVISTTFASFHRQFRGLPAKTLGWLLIDEAGQAVPQAAVGALRKCRRSLVIGDPMQIEPIFGVNMKLIEHLADEAEELITGYGPHLVSVQTLADRSTAYGATIERDEKELWIGSPLRVHRRCSNPMFEVSNHIAYNGRMIQASSYALPDRDAGSSCWFHLAGIRSDKQYVTEQGEFVFERIISSFLQEENHLPGIYVISPFRRVAHRMRLLITDQQQWFLRLPPNVTPPGKRHLKDWAVKRIGTVHTFQGKEEDAVYLVLGADKNSSGSARWAASKPNLLNVALTRARNYIYVVGDRQLWGAQQYFDQIASKLAVVNVGNTSQRHAVGKLVQK